MESDTFYEDPTVKSIWRLLGNLIYHVFFQTKFTMKSP